MKLFLIVVVFLAGCSSTGAYNSPSAQNKFALAQQNVSDCLIEQLLKSATTDISPEMAIRVSATRCEHTALKEAQKLRSLNRGAEFTELMLGVPSSSKAYTEGFIKKLTDKEELESRAESLLVMLIQEANKM